MTHTHSRPHVYAHGQIRTLHAPSLSQEFREKKRRKNAPPLHTSELLIMAFTPTVQLGNLAHVSLLGGVQKASTVSVTGGASETPNADEDPKLSRLTADGRFIQNIK